LVGAYFAGHLLVVGRDAQAGGYAGDVCYNGAHTCRKALKDQPGKRDVRPRFRSVAFVLLVANMYAWVVTALISFCCRHAIYMPARDLALVFLCTLAGGVTSFLYVSRRKGKW